MELENDLENDLQNKTINLKRKITWRLRGYN